MIHRSTYFKRLLPLLLLFPLLSGCQDSPDSPADEQASSDETTVMSENRPETGRPTPIAPRSATPQADTARLPADREALRERVREERERLVAQGAAESRRSMVRQRQLLADGRWWQDPSLGEELGLDSQQLSALNEAHDQRQSQQGQALRSLMSARRALIEALASGNTASADTALENLRQARHAQVNSQADWLDAVINHLDQEQLSQLAQSYPQLLLGRDSTEEQADDLQ